MQLIAGSLNVEVDEFLHAGYLSAYPRSIDEMGQYQIGRSSAEVVNVAEALALRPLRQVEPTATAAAVGTSATVLSALSVEPVRSSVPSSASWSRSRKTATVST